MIKRCVAILLMVVLLALAVPVIAGADVIGDPRSVLEEYAPAGQFYLVMMIVTIVVAVLGVVTAILIAVFWKKKPK